MRIGRKCNFAVTIIEIRPFRGGWQCFEGPGLQPYWTGDTAKEDAVGYATARSCITGEPLSAAQLDDARLVGEGSFALDCR